MLFVDPTKQLGHVSKLSYGTNIGPWTGVPFAMTKQVDEAGLTFLRFPGGHFGDVNDLTGQQIDDYIALCRKLQAEPAISVRLLNGTPERAAALVKYTNIEKQYKVKYWSIGNEPSLYGSEAKDPYDTERYNREWRTFAMAMRAADPSIVLVGPDIHQYDTKGGVQDRFGHFWMHEFLKTNGDLVDIVSFHRYPFPIKQSDSDPKIEQLRQNSREWDDLIPALRADIRATTGRDLPVAVTEVNSNWSPAFGGEATPDSFYNAIWWSDVLGRMIRQRVEIVAHFAIHGANHDGWGLVGNYDVTPTYYAFQMYKHFGDQLIYASSDEPLLSIFAAQRTDGALTLMIVNLGEQEVVKPVKINGSQQETAETWRLDQKTNAEKVEPTNLNGPIRFPGNSVTLLVVGP